MAGTNLWRKPDSTAGALYTRLTNKRAFIRVLFSFIVIAIIYNLYSSTEFRNALNDRMQPKVQVQVTQQMEPDFQQAGPSSQQFPNQVSLSMNGTEKATLVMLVRNRELREALGSMRSVEDRFNRKFHYPWTFLNDRPFTQEVSAPQSLVGYIMGIVPNTVNSLSNIQREWRADRWNIQ